MTWTMFELWYVAVIVALLGIPLYISKFKKYIVKKKSMRQSAEFALFLRRLSGCLDAGMTIRNAVEEIVFYNKQEYPILYDDLKRTYQLIEYNYSVVQAFDDMAKRCECRDIRLFADCISYAIPSGVDLVNLIRYISSSIDVKNDTRRDIQQILNLPKYNNRIL